ncbi:uncharacterized protein YndB with AHSA1/START domain [Rhodoligotrophos appendicifer]|uniref:SRPBCC family protein n=1 Tax=Rhodoligotrophos appendicifer TaxID=987056 RepID=UPI0011859F43|nr:SRPBCC family protein [Rhodoligotrophos appendicifer]
MSDCIEKSIEIKASVARVWRALTDYKEFGTWFQVALESQFVAGHPVRGRVTYPGFEHVTFEIHVQAIEPQTLFSFTWHPYAVDPKIDYSQEPQTLVEFRLQPMESGTLLSVRESGFDRIPMERRFEAYRMNEGGWAEQMGNIQRHAESGA